ncbi:MAG: hemolysin III family protein [Rubricoccaceae bacterium]|nr:hemolysin III family protein [Rubricoccaceae bacterium]
MDDELLYDPSTLRDEIASAVTHGLGALASVGAGAALITLAALEADGWHLVGTSVFVGALVLVYTASTLYHAVPISRAKAWLRIFDHCAIYVLIAGTYTPFLLTGARERWGWMLFAVIWTLAALGVVFKLFYTGRFPLLSTGIYLAMGWLGLVVARPLIEVLPAATLAWLIAGGVAYTAGTVFYHSRRIPYAHTVWHLFVLAGSVCHFLAVLHEVLRAG